MGTIIGLSIGGLDVDWSKNARGNDHGPLFTEANRYERPTGQNATAGSDELEDEGQGRDDCFEAPLRDVVARIELLGHTLAVGRKEYELAAAKALADYEEFEGEGSTAPSFMTFDAFLDFVRQHPISELDDDYRIDGNARDWGRRFKDAIAHLPLDVDFNANAYTERSFFGGLVGILHPYSALRVLAVNATNLDLPVLWQYGPLVDNGWATISEFAPGARRHQTFLIATEGSSDVHMLKHAFDLLRPNIADFFRFIDVSESHPFAGTGNLRKFAEGLAKIDVQNQLLLLLDNDAEGRDAFERLKKLSMPQNMKAMVLPSLPAFTSFPTCGPEGVRNADINGRAVSIECFLDLAAQGSSSPMVRWSNYKKELDLYQGSLDQKEDYLRAFLKQTRQSIASGSYDVGKVGTLLAAIIAECTSLAEAARMSKLPA